MKKGAWVLTITAWAVIPLRAAEPVTSVPWSYGASVAAYFVPEGQDFLLPTVSADRGVWHVEARYNYEGLNTASAWLGLNVAAGNTVAVSFTPMVGGVFGDTDGVAPGYHLSLDWRRLQLYSEGEYLFDSGTWSDSYFYAWSELTLAPVDWMRAGLVGQRTRVYESARDIQRGILLGVAGKGLSVTGHVFNLDQDKPLVVLSAAVEF
jgi:hypothetical protein